MKISRKTLVAVAAVLMAVFVFLKGEFGLSAGFLAALAGFGTAIGYVLFEAKLDLKKSYAQAGKWKDPKFWLGIVAVILAAVNTQFGLGIPAEAVIAVLGIIMTILFGKKLSTA